MAKDSTNTADWGRATDLPSDLPLALREVDLASTASDARHLEALVDSALDRIIPLQVQSPEMRDALQSATALLWVARDLAQLLEWKLNRLDDEAERRGRAARQ